MVDDLQAIPGVGPKMKVVLNDLGVFNVSELEGQDPEAMYQRLCKIRGTYVDRCVLYSLRSAVYFASETPHDPERLKWWNWHDDKL
jgi:hypothetical protein